MIIPDINEMLSHKEEIYFYLGHLWTNKIQGCGCVSALCLDVRSSDIQDEIEAICLGLTNMRAQLKNRDSLSLNETTFNQIKVDYELSNVNLINKMNAYKKRYSFPEGIEFSGDNFYLKLFDHPNCNRD